MDHGSRFARFPFFFSFGSPVSAFLKMEVKKHSCKLASPRKILMVFTRKRWGFSWTNMNELLLSGRVISNPTLFGSDCLTASTRGLLQKIPPPKTTNRVKHQGIRGIRDLPKVVCTVFQYFFWAVAEDPIGSHVSHNLPTYIDQTKIHHSCRCITASPMDP